MVGGNIQRSDDVKNKLKKKYIRQGGEEVNANNQAMGSGGMLSPTFSKSTHKHKDIFFKAFCPNHMFFDIRPRSLHHPLK